VKIAKTAPGPAAADARLKGRLVQAAVKLDLSENDIICHALRAVVNAIDYKIDLPLEMALAKAPIKSHLRRARQPEAKYPRGKPQETKSAQFLAFLIISSSQNPGAR
jgi:hypothetical protein